MGKNHSVNRERSHSERRRAKIGKLRAGANLRAKRMCSLTAAIFFTGAADTWSEAEFLAIKVRRNIKGSSNRKAAAIQEYKKP